MRISDWSSDVCSSYLRDSAKDMVCSKENPHVRPLSINFMGPHRRTSNPRNPQFQLSDAKPIHKMVFETIPQVVVAGEDKSLSFEPNGLNPTGHPLWSNELMSIRSAERHLGKECVRPCRSRGSLSH